MSNFSVLVKNESGGPWKFYMFQEDPSLSNQHVFSTSWLVHPFLTTDTATANFQWTLDYDLDWSQTTVLDPGTILNLSQSMNVNLGGNPNTVDFTIRNNEPKFNELRPSGDPGSFYINTQGVFPEIPSNTFAFGLAVNGELAFATQAKNNVLLRMTPTPTYYLAAGNDIVNNMVLNVGEISSKVKFEFVGGENHAKITFGPGQVWSDIEYSSTPFSLEEAELL